MKLNAQQEAAFRFIKRRLSSLWEEYGQFIQFGEQEFGPYRHLLHEQFGELHRHEIQTYKEKLENLFSDTDDVDQKIDLLKSLTELEKFLSHGTSMDYKRYIQMGLRVKPNDASFNRSLAWHLAKRQQESGAPPTDWNYNYIKYFRIAHENETDPKVKEQNLLNWTYSEAFRDYWSSSIKEIKNLVQLDNNPDELKEARCEIYKISLSFDYQCKLIIDQLLSMKQEVFYMHQVLTEFLHRVK